MKLSGAVRFAFAARAPDEVLDLEELTIGVACLGDAKLDFAAVSAELDRLADEVRDQVSLSAPPDRLAAQLASAFGGTLGFRGDPGAYSDPALSYLNVVLERRRGMPILLSVVWMLLGKRLGVPIHGIGYPGHFLVCVDLPGARVYVDPFNGGEVREARALLERLPTPRGSTDTARRMMEPVGVRLIIARMLTNLKNLWIDQGAHAEALAAVDRILLVTGENANEVRERALLLLHLARPAEAARDLRRYLVLEPLAADRAMMEQLLERVTESS